MGYFLPNISNPVTEHVFNKADLTFATGYCDPLVCELTYDDTNSSFNIDSVVELGLGCISQEDNDFHVIYFDYLEEHLDGANPYSYEITTNNGIRFLELTNANGNKALYASQLLAIEDQEVLAISLYPNPVKKNYS